jgi:4-diphosphocytidyl-2-C-methyl-D-erythritol kinase
MSVDARLTEAAPAKVNLCLFLGAARPHDGRHELVTVFQPLTLADKVVLEPAPLGARDDAVDCPGLELAAGEDNLALAALRAFRARTGWSGPPVRLTIDKRIPVAAGLAGGSADAAAALRLAARASGNGVDDALLRDVALGLGADVPAQVRPRPVLATGAGEVLEPVPAEPEPFAALLLPARGALSTAAVFREADRLGLGRDAAGLAERLDAVRAALRRGGPLLGLAPDLLVNDLEPAARALSDEVGEALGALRDAGAEHALVCGSGPTVAGFFPDEAAARGALVALAGREPRPVLAGPWRPQA